MVKRDECWSGSKTDKQEEESKREQVSIKTREKRSVLFKFHYLNLFSLYPSKIHQGSRSRPRNILTAIAAAPSPFCLRAVVVIDQCMNKCRVDGECDTFGPISHVRRC